jgi:hypothetical protein
MRSRLRRPKEGGPLKRAIVVCALALLTLMPVGCNTIITHSAPSLHFSPDQLPAGQTGRSYRVTITVSDNVTPVEHMSVIQGRLPRGLTMHSARGSSTTTIHGVPKEKGTFSIVISAVCLGTNVSGQAGSKSYDLVVN